MTNHVTLFHLGSLGVVELRLIKIVEFLGGKVQAVKLDGETPGQSGSLLSLMPPGGCAITSARTLAKLGSGCWSNLEIQAMLRDSKVHILVYGFEPGEQSSELLKE